MEAADSKFAIHAASREGKRAFMNGLEIFWRFDQGLLTMRQFPLLSRS